MPAQLRFTPLGQSPSSNGLGPIIGEGDLPDPGVPVDGPVDYRLSHFRFTDRFAAGMDIEYDQNGNLLAVEQGEWLNQQVSKVIQSSPDPDGQHPAYGTNIAAAVGQKRVSTYTRDVVAGNVRGALLRQQIELLSQPGITNDQAISEIEEVFVDVLPDDPRSTVVIAFLRTRSGKLAPIGTIVSL